MSKRLCKGFICRTGQKVDTPESGHTCPRSLGIKIGKVLEGETSRNTIEAMFLTAHEHRLCRYKSNLERFWGQTKSDYFGTRGKDAVDILAGGFGAALNTVTSLPDAVIGDVARKIEGRTDAVAPLSGHAARIRETTGGLVSDLLHLRILSAGAKVLKVPGDLAMDAYDAMIGNDHRTGA